MIIPEKFLLASIKNQHRAYFVVDNIESLYDKKGQLKSVYPDIDQILIEPANSIESIEFSLREPLDNFNRMVAKELRSDIFSVQTKFCCNTVFKNSDLNLCISKKKRKEEC